MSFFQKLTKKNSVLTLIIVLVVAYGLFVFYKYLYSKNASFSMENFYGPSNQAPQKQNGGNGRSAPQPAEPLGQNETFAQVKGISSPSMNLPASCNPKQNIQNPGDLLPKDSNNQWAQLNPSGKGALADVTMLNAGYHIGINTVSSSLRNANLQIRSEPPNPQKEVGPWNQSTITPDFMRPPLEIGGTRQ
jgi:hypothetical protein